jgi:SAM-dependent methyltransferase
VPRSWFGELTGARVLCLASGGGQQAPILAAAGAAVTVLDNSPEQLAQDRLVAEREGLSLTLELGVMEDLSRFADEAFDLVFHPVSNVFVPEVRPVWAEAFRVLAAGGALLAGFANPALFLFDEADELRGHLVVRHRIPYSDLALPEERLAARVAAGEPLEFGHTLDDQIGGQLAAGFVLTGFYEDRHPPSPLAEHLPCFIATRAHNRSPVAPVRMRGRSPGRRSALREPVRRALHLAVSLGLLSRRERRGVACHLVSRRAPRRQRWRSLR